MQDQNQNVREALKVAAFFALCGAVIALVGLADRANWITIGLVAALCGLAGFLIAWMVLWGPKGRG